MWRLRVIWVWEWQQLATIALVALAPVLLYGLSAAGLLAPAGGVLATFLGQLAVAALQVAGAVALVVLLVAAVRRGHRNHWATPAGPPPSKVVAVWEPLAERWKACDAIRQDCPDTATIRATFILPGGARPALNLCPLHHAQAAYNLDRAAVGSTTTKG